MIDYNRLEETLEKYIHAIKYEEGTVEEYAKKLTNYIESLVEKGFKLVAKGKVEEVTDKIGFNRSVYIGGKRYPFTNRKLVDEYNGKNISIYISEDR